MYQETWEYSNLGVGEIKSFWPLDMLLGSSSNPKGNHDIFEFLINSVALLITLFSLSRMSFSLFHSSLPVPPPHHTSFWEKNHTFGIQFTCYHENLLCRFHLKAMPTSFTLHKYLSGLSYSAHFYRIESWLNLIPSVRWLIFEHQIPIWLILVPPLVPK